MCRQFNSGPRHRVSFLANSRKACVRADPAGSVNQCARAFLPLVHVDEWAAGCYTTGMFDGITEVGLVVAIAAVLGMLVGSVLATLGATTRRPRLGVTGARLCLSGPGVASIGMGLSLIGLPWPDALLAVLPVSFGALLLWLFRGRITGPYG